GAGFRWRRARARSRASSSRRRACPWPCADRRSVWRRLRATRYGLSRTSPPPPRAPVPALPGSLSSRRAASRPAPFPTRSRCDAARDRPRHSGVADAVLGIETSCDETSAAVLVGGELASLIILSQDIHQVFGGVVPELASRAHLAALPAVVDRALQEAGLAPSAIDAVAVTAGPGLAGALLVGVVYAKSFAYAGQRALIGVPHLEGPHFAPALEDKGLAPPFVALLVSGGHTLLLDVPAWGRYRLLGETRDDAAGEAFDKVATLLGLGYPGGPAIERLAREGDPARFSFPRPTIGEG